MLFLGNTRKRDKIVKKKIIFLYLDNIENDIEKMRIRKQALQKHFQQNKKINKNQKKKNQNEICFEKLSII